MTPEAVDDPDVIVEFLIPKALRAKLNAIAARNNISVEHATSEILKWSLQRVN